MRSCRVLSRTMLGIFLAFGVIAPAGKASWAYNGGYVQPNTPAWFNGDAAQPAAPNSRPDDEHWDSQFGQPGMNGGVNVMLIGPDGDLYAGGGFQQAGGVMVNHIARWDGTAWHPLGSGMDSTVHTMAFGPNGDLYAGGDFFTAGGVTVNHIAHWDGVAWHSLGSGMSGRVNALAVGIDGSLYAGGLFTVASGATVNRIARWNGATWHSLGSGMNGSVDAVVMGQDGILYASGDFTHAGGATVNHIARWDGAEWSPLGLGFSGMRSARTLVFGGDGYLYAGGTFTVAGGLVAHYIARWDGDSWEALSSGVNSFVFALAIGLDGSLYAGGAFSEAGGETTNFIARWDGTAWHPLGSGMDSWVHTLVFGPDGSLFAGGEFTSAGGTPSSYVARWTGMAAPPGDPVVLVHGYKGLNLSLFGDNRDQWRSCSAGIELYSATNPRHNEWGDIPNDLPDYSFYVANLDTSVELTPRIEDNARCLRDQINRVAQLAGKPVIVIAHSMGGLVSRAYMEDEGLFRGNVAHLITLGTPHGGINVTSLFKLLSSEGVEAACENQRVLCQFGWYGIRDFNNNDYPNRAPSTAYSLIGGETYSDRASALSASEGPNDNSVGKFSAAGFYWPFLGVAVDDNYGLVGRFQTSSDHSSYFRNEPTISCIKQRLGYEGNCEPIWPRSTDNRRHQDWPLSGRIRDSSGTVGNGQVISGTVAVDTTGASMVMLTWMHGSLPFTLTSPSGLTITPAYAVAHPDIVRFDSGEVTSETPPWASYFFTNTVPGEWTLWIGPSTSPEGTTYLTNGYLQTDLLLAAGPDRQTYEIGAAATFTASLTSGSVGVPGSLLEVMIDRSDGVSDTVPMLDSGDGNYQATYTVPSSPGYMIARVVASGTNNGVPFTRQVDLELAVASPYVEFSGSFLERTPDEDNDGQFDALLVDVGITAMRPSTISLAGRLAVTGATNTLNALAHTVVSTGVQTITLSYPGRSVHRLREDGPYVITDVIVRDLAAGGVTADTAHDVLVTAAYDYRQFGLRGDVNDSCEVDVEDIAAIAGSWSAPSFDPVLDINRDGLISIADVMLATSNWGSSCWE